MLTNLSRLGGKEGLPEWEDGDSMWLVAIKPTFGTSLQSYICKKNAGEKGGQKETRGDERASV